MNHIPSSALPIASLQPVVNARQHWVGLGLMATLDATGMQSMFAHLVGENGLFAATGNFPIIIPCSEPQAIQRDDVAQFPHSRLIIVIPAALPFTETLEMHLKQLQGAGLRFMLDGPPIVGQQLSSSILALRYMFSESAELVGVKECMRNLTGLHLAYQVESKKSFECAKAAGFNWFAGNFLLHIQDAQADATSRGRLLKLLALIGRDADARELESLLKQDLALSFHLLKLVNSAAFAPGAPISSFTQAINVLGRRQLQRWLQLLLYARPEGQQQGNPLLAIAALRASLTESLCAAQGGNAEQQEKAFMVGMFSLLNVVMAGALEDVIHALKLDDAIVDALLHRTGEFGQLLQFVEAASSGASIEQLAVLAPHHIQLDQYWPALIKAYRWAHVVMQEG